MRDPLLEIQNALNNYFARYMRPAEQLIISKKMEGRLLPFVNDRLDRRAAESSLHGKEVSGVPIMVLEWVTETYVIIATERNVFLWEHREKDKWPWVLTMQSTGFLNRWYLTSIKSPFAHLEEVDKALKGPFSTNAAKSAMKFTTKEEAEEFKQVNNLERWKVEQLSLEMTSWRPE